MLLVIDCIDSQPGPNSYGPSPKDIGPNPGGYPAPQGTY